MEMTRSTWTDARLDDFATKVDRRFDEVDRRIDDFSKSVDRRFDEANDRFAEFAKSVDRRFGEVDERMTVGFKRLDDDLREIRGELVDVRRSIIQMGVALFVTQVTAIVAMLGLVAAKL
jgi:hypothetical protein